MDILDGAGRLAPSWRDGILALGNFDGVHLGHQAVVARAHDLARRNGRAAMVVTFDPHPVRHFRPGCPPFRLTTVEQRARRLAEHGVDAMVVLPFDATLAELEAAAFFDHILVDHLGAGGLVTGEGFRFGRDRTGDVPLLRRLGRPIGIQVDAEAPVLLGGLTVSSTRIREDIRSGLMVSAADLLGRPFVIEGTPSPDRGGTSIPLDDYIRPQPSRYRVRVRTDGGETWRGIGRSIDSGAVGDDARFWLPAIFAGARLEIELLQQIAD